MRFQSDSPRIEYNNTLWRRSKALGWPCQELWPSKYGRGEVATVKLGFDITACPLQKCAICSTFFKFSIFPYFFVIPLFLWFSSQNFHVDNLYSSLSITTVPKRFFLMTFSFARGSKSHRGCSCVPALYCAHWPRRTNPPLHSWGSPRTEVREIIFSVRPSFFFNFHRWRLTWHRLV